ncbi:MAG TPA: LysM peptidoglycan-binding domain-containing protein [Bacteroidales bacterium]|nr:MAG: membrane-bound lytic murein transglycosylase D [Bacteroidetes bacterium ADurb.Bin145]HOU02190.1 LysM peptidoglycan-binding domain-containing protein [Bacteroidales bacterium]HQK68208.1 LysM peptidoglycan-binding domain-containing protein [Bacteroidales bacterium]
MISKRILHISFVLSFFIISVHISDAQVVVERSKDKVIISGSTYYIHLVKKGETPYSISRAYGITIEELNRENPPAVYGIKEGQTLRIPYREISDVKPVDKKTDTKQRDEIRYIYHRLLPGETVYHLSKLYGVSENAIIESNPGVDITKLPVNAEIAVPRKEFMTEKQEFAIQDSRYIFHKVEKGESLATIADKYGLTVRQLRKENRDVRFPQVGDYLRIPAPKVQEPVAIQVTEPELTVDTVPQQPSDSVVVLPRPAGYTPVRDLKGSFDVAVLLPFYTRDNARRSYIDSSKIVKGKPVYKVVKRNDDWIYPKSLGFVEMYEGILMAADTLRSVGLDINLHVYDIKDDTLELSRLIKQGVLSTADLIIGPVYSSNLKLLTDYTRELKIPVVSPVPILNEKALENNPGLFMSVASLRVSQDILVRKAGEYFDSNIVFIHTDTTGINRDIIKFREAILNELASRLPPEEIRFKELLFYSRSVFSNDSINRLGHALSETRNNVVIIASEEPPVIGETLMDLHSLSKKFKITVFGYPVMRSLGLENLDPKYLFDLDLLVFSPYWIDYSRDDVKQFNYDFLRKFYTQPSETSYAWLGYDVMYYFLSGLAIFGNEFIIHPEIHNPDLLHTEFDFRRKSMKDGFENIKLFPVRFTRNYEVKLDPAEDPQYQ